MIISAGVKKFLGTTLALLLAAGFGAGIVFGIKYLKDKEAREDLLRQPAIAENTAALTSQETVVRARTTEHRTTSSDFRRSAAVTLRDPGTSQGAKETIKKGEKALASGDSLISAKDSVIRLLYRRDTLLTDDAVRARRGKLIQVHAAAGYAPYVSAPAVRLGVNVNVSQRWGVTATTDVAMKYRMGNGDAKTEWLRTDFIGVNYRF